MCFKKLFSRSSKLKNETRLITSIESESVIIKKLTEEQTLKLFRDLLMESIRDGISQKNKTNLSFIESTTSESDTELPSDLSNYLFSSCALLDSYIAKIVKYGLKISLDMHKFIENYSN